MLNFTFRASAEWAVKRWIDLQGPDGDLADLMTIMCSGLSGQRFEPERVADLESRAIFSAARWLGVQAVFALGPVLACPLLDQLR